MAKYRVETDNGTYEVETDEPNTPAEPGMLQKAAQAITTPMRGFRGLGVMAQRAAEAAIPGGEDPSLLDVLDRGTAATKPGYEPIKGERIGAAIGSSIPLLPVAAEGLAANAALAAGASGLDTLSDTGDLKKAGTNAAITGALGLAIPAAVEGTLKGVSALYRGVVAGAKGVTRKIVDQVMESATDGTPGVQKAAGDFFSKISALKKGASEALDAAEKLPGAEAFPATPRPRLSDFPRTTTVPESEAVAKAAAMPGGKVTPEEVADSAAHYVQQLQDEAHSLGEKAAATLRPDVTVPTGQATAAFKNAQDQILTKRFSAGKAQQTAIKMLNNWQRALRQAAPDIYGSATGALEQQGEISEPVLKQIIQTIDDDASWEGVAGTPVEKSLRQVRHSLDNMLKQSNPQYAQAMEPVAERMGAINSLVHDLRLERGANKTVLPTDQTVSAVKSIGRGNKSISLSNADQAGFPGAQDIRDSFMADEAKKAALSSAQDAEQNALRTAEQTRRESFGKAVEDYRTTEAGRKEAMKQALTTKRQATNEALASFPKEYSGADVRAMAENAAKAGLGSPEHAKLAEELTKVLGDRGNDLANELMDAASKEVFARGRGRSVAGAVVEGATNQNPAVMKAIDKILKAVTKGGTVAAKAGVQAGAASSSLPGSLANMRKEARRGQ